MTLDAGCDRARIGPSMFAAVADFDPRGHNFELDASLAAEGGDQAPIAEIEEQLRKSSIDMGADAL